MQAISLFPFQRRGVERLLAAFQNGQRAFLLADEMGLGKTVQALAFAQHVRLPVTVIAPASLVPMWREALEAWEVKGDVVSYAKAASAQSEGRLLILDEAHYVKNPQAQRTKAVAAHARRARFVLAMTGTPLLNRIDEFAHLLSAVGIVSNAYAFLYAYASLTFERVPQRGGGWRDVRKYYLTDAQARRLAHDLNTRFPYLRRTKGEVGLELPAKLRTFITLEVTAREASWAVVQAAREVARKWGMEFDDDERLVEAVFDHLPGAAISTARRLYAIAKAEKAASYLCELIESTDKPLVVFYHHKEVLDTLKAHLPAPHIAGDTPQPDRARLVSEFQSGRHKVLYLSLTAASVGLTLTAADTAVFVEFDWVPANLIQAEDRINRIGQVAKTTYYHYLTANDRIEKLILRKLVEKTQLAKGVLGGDSLKI